MSDVKILALKVDVDTLRGYREGVPNLLGLLEELSVKASFFFSLGPDNSGKALVRVLRPGFLEKMRRTKAVSTYGWRTLLYGTLLPAPMIVESAPGILRDAARKGHDCGVHAWDHVKWQDRLEKLPVTTLEADFRRAFDLFFQRTGKAARSCAAPGWQVSEESLRVQDELGLDYCSDARGAYPFLPRWGMRTFRTPQIPSTLPTMDEILGRNGLEGSALAEHLLGLLREGLNVFTLHGEMEGMGQIGVFREFLLRARDQGVRFLPLSTVARTLDPKTLPVCPLGMRPIEGRAGRVATQVLEDPSTN